MQANMYFTGARYCTFISYDPRMPENLVLYTTDVQYDAQYMTDMLERVMRFKADLDALETKLRTP